jgi:hypothetical protein
VSLTDQERVELVELMKVPGFRNFLFRVIQKARIFDATANGTDQRHLIDEGRRLLGLEILREVEAAMPLQSPSGIPSLTVIQVLREEAQSPSKEKPSGRRADTYRDLDGTDGGSDG